MPLSANLSILATTDLHMSLFRPGYDPDKPDNALSHFTCLRTAIEAERSGAQTSILVDNGDLIECANYGAALAELAQSGAIAGHPMLAALDALGHDVITPGNHDFDYGLETYRAIIARSRLTVVNCNLRDPANDRPFFQPSVIIERRPCTEPDSPTLRIGITGVLPEQTMWWNHDQLDGRALISPMCAALETTVGALKADGADIVIVLAHSGRGTAEQNDVVSDNGDAAERFCHIPGVDVVIAGHSHEVWPPAQATEERAGETTAILCQPGARGSHLGVVHVGLVLDSATGRWVARRATCRNRPVPSSSVLGMTAMAGTVPDTLRGLVQTAIERCEPVFETVVGQTEVALHGMFATIEPAPAVRLVAKAQAWHLKKALAATQYSGLPVLAAASWQGHAAKSSLEPGMVIGPGPIRERDLGMLVPFANALVGLVLDGSTLRDWLEHAARVFRQLDPASPEQSLLSISMPTYLFDTIEGLSYTIDLSRPPAVKPPREGQATSGTRIRALRYRGMPVAANDRFAVAVSSYRAHGGGGFPGTGPAACRIPISPNPIKQVLRDYLSVHWPVPVLSGPVWQLAAPQGTTAVFGAAAATSGVPTPSNLRPVSVTSEGLVKYRISF